MARMRVIEMLKNFVSEEPVAGLCCKFEGGSLCFLIQPVVTVWPKPTATINSFFIK